MGNIIYKSQTSIIWKLFSCHGLSHLAQDKIWKTLQHELNKKQLLCVCVCINKKHQNWCNFLCKEFFLICLFTCFFSPCYYLPNMIHKLGEATHNPLSVLTTTDITLSTAKPLFKINHQPEITVLCFPHYPWGQLFVILSCTAPVLYNTADRPV